MRAGEEQGTGERRGVAWRGWVALVSGAVCIGFAAIWVRWSEVGMVATAFHRLALALPLLAVWMVWEQRVGVVGGAGTGRARGAVDWRWVVAGGVCFGLDLAAWHLSIRWTSVANATLLANLAPVFVTLGAWWLLGQAVTRPFLWGMLVALVGAWMLTGASFQVDPLRWRGDMLGVVTALFYGGYQLCVARLRQARGTAWTLWWSSVVGAVVLGLLSWALGEPMWPETVRGWGVVIGLALSAQVAGQGLITYGFAHLPAGHSSLTLLVQPLVAVGAGWWLLGERVGGWQAVGGGVLLAGILWARHGSGGRRG